MIILFLLFFWVIGSIGVREYAASKQIGQSRALIISLVLSPVVGLLLTRISKPKAIPKGKKKKIEFLCINCGHAQEAYFRICPECGKENYDTYFDKKRAVKK